MDGLGGSYFPYDGYAPYCGDNIKNETDGIR